MSSARSYVTSPSTRSRLHAAYALTSVNVCRKYIGILDYLFTDVMHQSYVYQDSGSQASLFVPPVPYFPRSIVFFSTPREIFYLAFGAMACHASQLVWFRYLYLVCSRYMWMNQLRRIH